MNLASEQVLEWKTRLTWTKWAYLQAIMNLVQKMLWSVHVSVYIHKPENQSSDIVSSQEILSSALQKLYLSKVWERFVSDKKTV